MEKLYNEISFCKRKSENENEFWERIKTQIKLLLEEEYVFKVRMEDCGVVVIEFNYDANIYGGPELVWIDEDEYIEKREK